MPFVKMQVNEWDRFGKLVVISEINRHILPSWQKPRRFLLQCDCGNKHTALLWNLRKWEVISCGCEWSVKITHWMRSSRLYRIWACMKARCNDKNSKRYKDWWGRWIIYDTKRETFEWFYEDMWSTYQDWLSIDRIDNNGNYCKENCRRATTKEQSRNTSTNTIYDWKCLTDWAEQSWIWRSTLWFRIKKMWLTIQEALQFKR